MLARGNTLTGATLFSGIGAPETAMPHWRWPWHAEIEKFPSSVLAQRHPDSANLGDVTANDFTERAAAIARPSVLVFGSPCQSFSVAGKRLGLDDPRGNLALCALGIVARLKPRWFVFENVPGLLSSAEGRDFGLFLRTVDELGYSLAWTVLGAQHFGVAQRRERVFAVGHFGDWRGPAAVLFEPEGLCGDHPPRRQAGKGTAPTLAARTKGGGGLGTDFDRDGGLIAGSLNTSVARGTGQGNETDFLIALPLTGNPYGDHESREGLLVSHALRADGFDASEDGTGRGTPIIPVQCNGSNVGTDLPSLRRGNGHITGGVPAIAFSSKDFGADAMADLAPTLRAGTHDKSHANAGVPPAVTVALRGREGGGVAEMGGEQATALRACQGGGDKPHVLSFHENQRAESTLNDTAGSLKVGGGKPGQGYPAAMVDSAVRRLTPRECERLQGYPDDYTLVTYRGKPAADGPRYKALGNSMAVPVMRWILARIEALEVSHAG